MRLANLLLISIASFLVAGCGPTSEPVTPKSHPVEGVKKPEDSVKPIETVKPQVIRVMTFNIHHGRGTDGKVDMQRQADVINAAKPDIVGLQELDRGVTRSGRIDQIGELARLTGMTFYFDKNIDYQGGEYGSAMLTRFPILQQTNTYYKSMHPGERRAVQQVVLDVNGRKLLFMNTHMDYRPEPEERLMNIGELEQAMKAYPDLPVILTGDLNDDPNSQTHNRFKEMFIDVWEAVGEGNGYTYHGPDRDKRLDYILISKADTLQPVSIRVIETPASDHMPVVADIRLK